MLRKLKGQSTLEYALIITVVVAALLLMQHYMKRGVQGKLREATDEIAGQYSAGNMTSIYRTQQMGSLVTKEDFGTDGVGRGVSRYEVLTPAETKRSATGGEAETITTSLSGEALLP